MGMVDLSCPSLWSPQGWDEDERLVVDFLVLWFGLYWSAWLWGKRHPVCVNPVLPRSMKNTRWEVLIAFFPLLVGLAVGLLLFLLVSLRQWVGR